jgi:hypothetical protein
VGGHHSPDSNARLGLRHTRALDPFRLQAVEFAIQPRIHLVGWGLLALRGGPCLKRHLARILWPLVWWELDDLSG